MPLKGRKKHIDRLKRLAGPELVKVAGAVAYEGADLIRSHAHYLISRGSVSGKSHAPSAPGQPPNRDTGHLQNNLIAVQKKPLVSEVRSEAEYAAIHEFGGTIKHPGGTHYFIGSDGTPRFVNKSAGAFMNMPMTKPHTITMSSRPYMRPARDAKKKEIRKRFAEQINKLVKRSGK